MGDTFALDFKDSSTRNDRLTAFVKKKEERKKKKSAKNAD